MSASALGPERNNGLINPVRIRTSPSTKGIGEVILRPDSDALIAGVKIVPYPIWPDDRGYFQEIVRIGGGPTAGFLPSTTQISATYSFPGTIKAFHYHLEQADFWTVVSGTLQVALVDLRIDSPSFGLRNTLYVGPLRPWHVLIPPGVGHGYKVIGETPGVLVYVTDRTYNPNDERRLLYNDPEVNYDWEIQHK